MAPKTRRALTRRDNISVAKPTTTTAPIKTDDKPTKAPPTTKPKAAVSTKPITTTTPAAPKPRSSRAARRTPAAAAVTFADNPEVFEESDAIVSNPQPDDPVEQKNEESKPSDKTAPAKAAVSPVDELTAMLGRTTLNNSSTVSAPGPPPARAQTAYFAYLSAKRDAVKEAEPALKPGEVTKRVASMWNLLSAAEKAPFEDAVRQDRQRYEKEKSLYQQRVAKAEEEKEAVEFLQKKLLQERAMEFYLQHHPEGVSMAALCGGEEEGKETAIERPKQARTAYNFFAMMSREEGAGIGESAAAVGEDWKAVQKSRKKKDMELVARCKKQAEEDVLRFEEEMEEYEANVEAARQAKGEEAERFRVRAVQEYRAEKKKTLEAKKYRAMVKDQRAAGKSGKSVKSEPEVAGPKRARSAYNLFFAEKAKDEGVKVRCEREKVSLASVVGEMWKNCEEEEKEKFNSMASEDRARYEAEKAAMGQEA